MSDQNMLSHFQNVQQSIYTMSVVVTCMASEHDKNDLQQYLLNQTAIVGVDVSDQVVTIYYDISIIHKNKILALIGDKGYQIQHKSLFEEEPARQPSFSHLFSKSFVLLMGIAVLFIIQSTGMHFGKDFNWLFGLHTEFLLASLVQFVLCFSLYRKLYGSIKTGINNTDILIVIATQTIWTYSTFIYFALIGVIDVALDSVDTYFHVSVIVLALTVIGQLIQEKMQNHHFRSDNLYAKHTPTFVDCVTTANDLKVLEPEKLEEGYVVQLEEGDYVAGDGVIVNGFGWFNEGHLTGNNTLVQKKQGDEIFAGSLLENGRLLYKIHRLGTQTRFGCMIETMATAQESRVPISVMVDKVLAVFVPLVLILATVVLLFTYYTNHSLDMAILRATSVLIVACPCVFWLATSSTIIAGTGIAAQSGIWFNNAAALQKLSTVDTIVFNKTTTLTEGNFQLVSHYFFEPSIQLTDVLQLAASVESQFHHPIAQGICQAAKQQNIELFTVTEPVNYAGEGVAAVVDGMGMVRVGKPSWIGAKLPDSIQNNLPTPFKTASLVAVSVNDIVLGFLVLLDELYDNSHDIIRTFQDAGIETIIMSGDENSVPYFAQKLGVSQFYASLTPQQKAEKITALKTAGHTVAMVGHGVSDAAAMEHADSCFDVSRSVHDNTTGDNRVSAVLMGESLTQVHQAQQVANATAEVMKQNVRFALLYNLMFVAIAMCGWLTPISAVFFMLISTIVVLTNVRRLNYYTLD